MNPKVDWYFDKNKKWQEEIVTLRTIVLEPISAGYELKEELKWGCPCYTFQENNIVLIHVFKDYCALLFFKGALLKDPKGILVQQTANVQAARQIRFTSVQEIKKGKRSVKAYLKEAVDVEKAGLKVPLKKTKEYDVPEEFQNKLDGMPTLKKAFSALTPGRQRGYLFFFSQAKQSKTRTERVKKCIPKILNGTGLDD